MNSITRTSYLDSLPRHTDDLPNLTKERQHPWYYPLSEFLQRIYLQFLLVTTLYVMEPWERLLMLTIFIFVISLMSYSAFVYIPFHVHHILQSTMPSLTDVFMQ